MASAHFIGQALLYLPSLDGVLRYPPHGVYKGAFEDEPYLWKVCTCKPDCPPICKGYCGCEACWESYRDELAAV